MNIANATRNEWENEHIICVRFTIFYQCVKIAVQQFVK